MKIVQESNIHFYIKDKITSVKHMPKPSSKHQNKVSRHRNINNMNQHYGLPIKYSFLTSLLFGVLKFSDRQGF